MLLAIPNTQSVSLAAMAADAFGRQRVSDPITVFDSQFQYDAQPILWQQVLTGSGTVTHLPNESSLALAVTTASGDKVVRQSKQYFRYQPGKSQLILITGVPADTKTNVRWRYGYFDASNGIFFENDGVNMKIVRRTNVSGTPTDNAVNKSSWSYDKFDGSGPSRKTLDLTKSQIMFIDLEWLGMGAVRTGFVIDGNFYIAHVFYNSNTTLSTVYMTTANLPVRVELENTGVAASGTTIKHTCCSVISEGGFENDRGYQFGASNGVTAISANTRRPILSIRPKTTFNSITNRALINLIESSVSVVGGTNSCFYELVYGGTLTGAAFSSVDASSVVEFDVSASAIANGISFSPGHVPASNTVRASVAKESTSKYPFTLDINGANPDVISVVVTGIGGAASVVGTLTWKEIR